MPKYTKITTDLGHDFIVKSNDDGSESWIPVDESNSDYQAYLNPEEVKADEAETK